MSSQRSARYPLRSQDLPMNRDLFAPLQTSDISQARMLDGGSYQIMPSSIDRMANNVSDVCYNLKPYSRNGPLTASKPAFQWEGLQEASILYQDPFNCQPDQDYRYANYEATSELPCGQKTMGDTSWDCGYIHNPEPTYSSLTCPRGYPSENDSALKDLMQSNIQAHPPSAYCLESARRTSHPSISTLRPFQRELLTVPGGLTPDSYLADNMFPAYSPSLSRSSTQPTKLDFSATVSPDTVGAYESFNECLTMNGDEGDGDGSMNSEPYAQLIYRALKSASGHKVVLKEIYEWFERNTDKAKNSSSKGWQNSIRHNLSMNGAFKKVEQLPPTDESKKGFVWVLDPSAIEEGVKSTTRYRTNKKIGKAEHPAPQRQRSGAKGGKAAKKAAKLRRSARFDESRNLRYLEGSYLGSKLAPTSNANSPSEADPALSPLDSLPLYLQHAEPVTRFSIPDSRSYGYSDIIGCVQNISSDLLFYDDPKTEENSPTLSFYDSGENLLDYGANSVT